MQSFNDNYSFFEENEFLSAAVYSVIGDRSDQQDRAGSFLFPDGGIVTVCDGMGGHSGGAEASKIAVQSVIDAYKNSYPCENIPDLLMNTAVNTDKKIAALCNENGASLNAGTTCVAVVIREKSAYWLSVGDSRIYIYRNGAFKRATTDHNYRLALEEGLASGEISREKYECEKGRGEALISYFGVGNLSIMDCNKMPMTLMSGDKLLLISDGLYKVLSDDEIGRIVANFKNTSETLRMLDAKAKKAAEKNRINRDNTTLALISIK